MLQVFLEVSRQVAVTVSLDEEFQALTSLTEKKMFSKFQSSSGKENFESVTTGVLLRMQNKQIITSQCHSVEISH